MTRKSNRPACADFSCCVSLLLFLGLAQAVFACERPPQLPRCSADSGIKLVTGWAPGKGACASGTLTVSLSLCSDAGGAFDYVIGLPQAPTAGACRIGTIEPPATACARVSPGSPRQGSLTLAPGGCETIMVEYQLRDCAPAPGGLVIEAEVTDPTGATCTATSACQVIDCLSPESGFPSITVRSVSSLVTAPASGAATWAWEITYDGDEPSSGPHCLALTQVNGLADELFPVTLRDAAGNVLTEEGFEQEDPGTVREMQFATVDVAAGEVLRIFGECPFKGVCFPGLDNEFRLEARVVDEMTGDCLPLAVSAAEVRAVVEGFPPLRQGALEDLGEGRFAAEWVLRGPLREPNLELRIDGHLTVESATAAFQRNPTALPGAPTLLAEQPVVDASGRRGGAEVSLQLPFVGRRDADPEVFEDNVVVRLVLQDPSGSLHRGKLDNGATLSFLGRDGDTERVRLQPVRVE